MDPSGVLRPLSTRQLTAIWQRPDSRGRSRNYEWDSDMADYQLDLGDWLNKRLDSLNPVIEATEQALLIIGTLTSSLTPILCLIASNGQQTDQADWPVPKFVLHHATIWMEVTAMQLLCATMHLRSKISLMLSYILICSSALVFIIGSMINHAEHFSYEPLMALCGQPFLFSLPLMLCCVLSLTTQVLLSLRTNYDRLSGIIFSDGYGLLGYAIGAIMVVVVSLYIWCLNTSTDIDYGCLFFIILAACACMCFYIIAWLVSCPMCPVNFLDYQNESSEIEPPPAETHSNINIIGGLALHLMSYTILGASNRRRSAQRYLCDISVYAVLFWIAYDYLMTLAKEFYFQSRYRKLYDICSEHDSRHRNVAQELADVKST